MISGYWAIKLGKELLFDNIAILCVDRDMKNVERVYIIPKSIIPKSELSGYTNIVIHTDFSRTKSKFVWIEKFRVNEIPYNDVYHTMRLDDCKVLKS